MADSRAFEWLCGELERSTPLDRLQARGTLRLALKQAGLRSRTVTAVEMEAVVRRALPSELRVRGIQDEGALCRRLALGLAQAELGAQGAEGDSPEAVFRRLAGS